jgi:hypothetical protein
MTWTGVTIASIFGKWRGTIQMTANFPSTLGLRPTPGTRSSVPSSCNRTDYLWFRVELPNDPSLAGKDLNCKTDIRVKYPFDAWQGFNKAVVGNFTHSYRLKLGDPGAGAQYHQAFWDALIFGAGMNGGDRPSTAFVRTLSARLVHRDDSLHG